MLVRVARGQGYEATGAARTGTDIELDLTDLEDLQTALDTLQPDAVINCAAIVDHQACEDDPGAAYRVNARPVSALAEWSKSQHKPIVQVSTDQYYFASDPKVRHTEQSPVTLTGEYARSKFAGDQFALTSPHALVVRTNMVAARGGKGKKSLAEWAFEQIDADAPMTLFTDYFCSTIDARSLSEIMLDLLARGATGLMHVASSDTVSKKEFIEALAAARGVKLGGSRDGLAAEALPGRLLNLGLDVTRVTRATNHPMPGLETVAQRLAEDWERS